MMTIFKKFFLWAILLSGLLTLTACGSYGWYPFLYHPTLAQGNLINPNAVAILKIGMTKEQVRNLMGTPLLETPLSSNTWHYVYILREKNKIIRQQQIILYFSNNNLIHIQN